MHREGNPTFLPSAPFYIVAAHHRYVQHQANRILVKIAVNDVQLMPATSMQIYFAWVLNAIQMTESDSTLLALASLQVLLRQEAYRRPFFEYADSIHQLREILKFKAGAASSIQPQYMVMVVLWVLTFDSCIAAKLEPQFKCIGDIAKLLVASRKEKVIRMCLATLANLVQKPKNAAAITANAETMISFKVLPFVEKRAQNEDYGADEDVKGYVTVLNAKLASIFEEMS